MLKEKLKKAKNKTKDFFKKNKKVLGIGVASAIAGVLAVIVKANKDASDLTYSDKFFRNASDDQLEIEREKVRLKRNSSYDDVEYDKYYNLLNKFDNVMSKRTWGDEEPTAPSYYSEHGWYLPEDDD